MVIIEVMDTGIREVVGFVEANESQVGPLLEEFSRGSMSARVVGMSSVGEIREHIQARESFYWKLRRDGFPKIVDTLFTEPAFFRSLGTRADVP